MILGGSGIDREGLGVGDFKFWGGGEVNVIFGSCSGELEVVV